MEFGDLTGGSVHGDRDKRLDADGGREKKKKPTT